MTRICKRLAPGIAWTLMALAIAAGPARAQDQGTATNSDAATEARLHALAEGDHRSESYRARNEYRHPAATLMWLGLRDDMTVVEISPGGGGWYSEILAPFLKAGGTYYAAGYDLGSTSEYEARNARRLAEKLEARPDLYGNVIVSVFARGQYDIAPEGSADMVLTFRNLHNWMEDGFADDAFAAFYRALKPGGILGVVEHRGDPAIDQDAKAPSGYVREDYVIALAGDAGFSLAGRTEINANPRDTKDHPKGVWTLPPSLDLEQVDREKYLAIGESDRMTLRFVKPALE